jgi:hypothetical protein
MKPILEKAWHKCEAVDCNRRVRANYCMCGAHRSILGWRANATLQQAWLERDYRLPQTRLAYQNALANARALINQGHVNTRME